MSHPSFPTTLALSLLLTSPLTWADEPVSLDCGIYPDRWELNLTDRGAPAYNHWRLDGSSDFQTWKRLGPVNVINGHGQLTIDLDPSEAPVDRMFFQAVLDNSLDNVINIPETPHNYANITLPAHLRSRQVRAEDNTPTSNPVTDAGAALGRVLFYDKKLSKNNTVSCSSCHQQEHGFSDPLAFSVGFEGGLTGRNSMGLSNAKFYERGHFFWDERSDTLEIQTLQPIQNEVEMGMTLTDLSPKLASYEYYEPLFLQAFGDTTVTSSRISLALSQFIRSLLSYQSKFDQGVASNFTNFTAEENAGRAIFNGRGRCATCHSGPNFVGVRTENNGLEFPFVDLGVGGVTGRAGDDGKFKMSSLRNIAQTAPYMHDGRFATLAQVIDHYSTGVVDTPTLGRTLRNGGQGGPARPNFSREGKEALIAFLRTLTDDSFLTDPKYADPFQ